MPGLELMGKIGLDGKAFEAELHKAHHLAMGVAEGVTDALKRAVITGVGVGTVEEALRRTVETAEELANTSKRLGIAVEQLQILKKAAKESGVELESIADAFEKIDEARQKAMISGKEGMKARRAFGALGITGDMLHSMTAAQLFQGPMSDAAKNANPEQLGAVFRELGIKGFGPLITVLQTDFGELGKKMHEMGAIMDTETISKIKLLGEELSLIGNILVAHVGPMLLKFVDIIMHAIAGVSATWAAIKAMFDNKPTADALERNASVTPGFGGFTHGQVEDMKLFKSTGRGPTGSTTAEEDAARIENAKKAGTEKLGQWEEFFRDLQEKFDKLKNQLDHPIQPDFTRSMLPQQLSSKALTTPSDSLVKVGNFLGGRGMGGLEVRKVDLLTQIANNTAQMLARNTITTATNMGAWGVNLVRGSIPNR